MAKQIKVIDLKTGEIEVDAEVNGGYCLQYSKGTDTGHLHIVGRVNNARYGRNHWIKNWAYQDTLIRLLKKYKDLLQKIDPSRFLFLEDMNYEPVNTERIDWVFRIKKAPKDMVQMWGYFYIIESRNYWVERISDGSIAANIYRCLRRIDNEGGLKDYEIMDFEETYEEFGKDWVSNPNRILDDILDDDFDWEIVRKAKDQVSLVDYMEEKKKRGAI